eukprot:6185380-Pleurochrysis_carterae.AAC.3
MSVEVEIIACRPCALGSDCSEVTTRMIGALSVCWRLQSVMWVDATFREGWSLCDKEQARPCHFPDSAASLGSCSQ